MEVTKYLTILPTAFFIVSETLMHFFLHIVFENYLSAIYVSANVLSPHLSIVSAEEL